MRGERAPSGLKNGCQFPGRCPGLSQIAPLGLPEPTLTEHDAIGADEPATGIPVAGSLASHRRAGTADRGLDEDGLEIPRFKTDTQVAGRPQDAHAVEPELLFQDDFHLPTIKGGVAPAPSCVVNVTSSLPVLPRITTV